MSKRRILGSAKKAGFMVCMIVPMIMLFSCATTIKTIVQRPAELNLGGAETMAVLPFETESSDKELADIAEFLNGAFKERLVSSSYFDMVDSYSVQTAVRNRGAIPCDVYILGKLINYSSPMEKGEEVRIRKNSEGEEEEYIATVYWRPKVLLKIDYEIVDARSHKTLYTEKYSCDNIKASSTKYEDKNKVPSPLDEIRYRLNSFVTDVMKKVQPYEQEVSLKLLSDKTKDPLMKEANTFAKNGQLTEAYNLFVQCYEDNGYMEAGYNAALILQIQGDLEGAKELMTEIVQNTGNAKASEALLKIEKEIESAKKLEAQLSAM